MQPTPTPAGQPAHTTPYIPDDQDKKADLAVRLANAWKKRPDLVFIWTTQAAYQTDALAYQKSIVDKTAAASLRAGITLTLAEADDQITEGLPYLKAALLTKFKKGKDKAMYPQFGLVARNGGFELPKKHVERAKALTVLVGALATHGLGAGDYGTSFWTPVAAAYTQGDQDAKDSAATVGGLVGTKNTFEAKVDVVLRKMLVLLDAQYPDEKELEAKRREMGYLKEYN